MKWEAARKEGVWREIFVFLTLRTVCLRLPFLSFYLEIILDLQKDFENGTE